MPAQYVEDALSVCPANLTGKPLDPREIILKVGQVMSDTGEPPVPATVTTPIDLKVKLLVCLKG